MPYKKIKLNEGARVRLRPHIFMISGPSAPPAPSLQRFYYSFVASYFDS